MKQQNIDLTGKTILVTGVASFIGANLVQRLLTDLLDSAVFGIDNMNAYSKLYNIPSSGFRFFSVCEPSRHGILLL